MPLAPPDPLRGRDAPAIGVRSHLLALAVLLLGLALIYGRAGGFGYAYYDDVDYVLHNDMVRAGLTARGVRWAFTAFAFSNWHPLTWLSHMADVSLFGPAPGPAHLVNVAFHGANTLLVYALALALLRNWLASVLVAYLFMAHPLHVESVAWIAERKDLLCALFFLLSVLAYLRHAARPSLGRYAWVACAFALALLSKPMAVTLPIVLLLLDFWPLERWRTVQPVWRLPPCGVLLAEKIPLFVLSAASGIVTLLAQRGAMLSMDALPLEARLMNSVVACAVYLRDSVLPTRLAVVYPLRPIDFAGSFLPSLGVLLAISIAALAYRRRQPWLLFGWLWFLSTLLPVIGLIQVGVQSHADRYMYLPSLGLLLAMGAALAKMSAAAWKKALLALVPALAFYSMMAWVQLGYWSGPYLLFTRTLEVAGENLRAHAALVGFYLREGHLPEAQAEALKAVSLDPQSPSGYGMLGMVRAADKDYAGAERMFRVAISKSPQNAQLLNNLANLLEQQGRPEEARQYRAAASKADPGRPRTLQGLSLPKRPGG